MRTFQQTLRLYRTAREREIRQVCKDFELPFNKKRAEVMIDQEEEKIRAILMQGLDIGGIIEYKVDVGFEYNETHGFVFTRRDNGEMFLARKHVQGGK